MIDEQKLKKYLADLKYISELYNICIYGPWGLQLKELKENEKIYFFYEDSKTASCSEQKIITIIEL